ncbi:DASH family cryptochrome [Gilvimarinus xylanilyticus]|uniref:Cryptochrome DASH n=1 Tax=Gilvimarinus xylanilyticus TaxID=2944139 RepID=A0A9X2KSP4_9GAMM|nr:DASH family cryptochrome [Gilvimarinus xylanilyticus]MCP8898454.1 DASH family cryptochrome [Gilvimarinus xylanilyticus]
MKVIGLYIFDNDCRLQDNPALAKFSEQVDELICLYCLKPQDNFSRHFSHSAASSAQRGYLQQTLAELARGLSALDQRLLVEPGPLLDVVGRYIRQYSISHIGRSVHPGLYEQNQWQQLQQQYPEQTFVEANSSSLFDQEDLPFPLAGLPTSFTPFRKRIETIDPVISKAGWPNLPAPAQVPLPAWPHALVAASNDYYRGGEVSAQQHLARCFTGTAPRHYKETRNELMGQSFSTELSGYLAHGALSPRQVVTALREYEARYGANESTYWIYFELLWREYFYWSARARGKKLFTFDGGTGKGPQTSFYPSRFKQWCQGTTPFPLVNALMGELNATGWMSNRGRQIAASCLVNELQLDWRYGAAYFEQCLIDYDVASNWGNWQYIAGVGADPRGGRHFNLDKQGELYDPEGTYVARWSGEAQCQPLDQVDMVDWPLGGNS